MEHLIERNLQDNVEVYNKLISGEWEDDDVTILNPYEAEYFTHLIYSDIKAKSFKEFNSSACKKRFPNLKPNHEVIQWPLFWLFNTFIHSRNSVKLPTFPLPKEFFCTLNSRVQSNRTILWDELTNKNILNQYCSYIGKGLTVDLNPSFETRGSQVYPNYTEAEQIKSHAFPDFYQDILIDVVCETHTDWLFFTEKTWKPFLAERIPLIISDHGAYKKLEEWGFEPYTEIFDYSFDNVFGLEYRIQAIVEQLNTVIQERDLRQIYIETKEKREHNREVCLKLIQQENVPALALKDSTSLNTIKQARKSLNTLETYSGS